MCILYNHAQATRLNEQSKNEDLLDHSFEVFEVFSPLCGFLHLSEDVGTVLPEHPVG